MGGSFGEKMKDGMRWHLKFGFSILWVMSTVAVGSLAQKGEIDVETQGRGFWIDSTTGLMWAAKDNGRDINWRNASKYCRDLRLAGYSDWRLASIEELEGIYDETANAIGLGAGRQGNKSTAWHVKGNLFLTGTQWSSTQKLDLSGNPSGLVWYFDFWNKTRSIQDGSRFSGRFAGHGRRALCVRKAEP
jgi:hypothetical protein